MADGAFADATRRSVQPGLLGLVVSVWRWYRPRGEQTLRTIAEFMTGLRAAGRSMNVATGEPALEHPRRRRMYNLVLLASKPDDWTHEQFIEWWRGEHADVTYVLPGLRRWHHTDILDALEERSTGLGRHLDPELRRPGGP